jgi:hypothetical protein
LGGGEKAAVEIKNKDEPWKGFQEGKDSLNEKTFARL